MGGLRAHRLTKMHLEAIQTSRKCTCLCVCMLECRWKAWSVVAILHACCLHDERWCGWCCLLDSEWKDEIWSDSCTFSQGVQLSLFTTWFSVKIYWHCSHVCSRVYVMMWCLSISVPAIDCCSSMRPVCCCVSSGQEISIDCWTAGAAAAKASSVTFTATVEGCTLTWFLCLSRTAVML